MLHILSFPSLRALERKETTNLSLSLRPHHHLSLLKQTTNASQHPAKPLLTHSSSQHRPNFPLQETCIRQIPILLPPHPTTRRQIFLHIHPAHPLIPHAPQKCRHLLPAPSETPQCSDLPDQIILINGSRLLLVSLEEGVA